MFAAAFQSINDATYFFPFNKKKPLIRNYNNQKSNCSDKKLSMPFLLFLMARKNC